MPAKYDAMVRKLKGKEGVDNPHALARYLEKKKAGRMKKEKK